ncbi:hypothetical protein N431DRAFT_522159 [Stipitochalara longipes BDJ]|nr:hypothetical protein N431DRAFT_522159 [Stipitochalara longipes BDJ]
MRLANHHRKKKARAKEFHYFLKLSLEIRSMIWTLAIEPQNFHFSPGFNVMQLYDQPFSDKIASPPAYAEIMTRFGALNFNYATDLVYIDIPKPEDFARRHVIFKEQVIMEGQIKNVAIKHALLSSTFWRPSPEAAWSIFKASGKNSARHEPVVLKYVSDYCTWSCEVKEASDSLVKNVPDLMTPIIVAA